MPYHCEDRVKRCLRGVPAVANTPSFDLFTRLLVHIRRVEGS
jgi:hypothetical protein